MGDKLTPVLSFLGVDRIRTMIRKNPEEHFYEGEDFWDRLVREAGRYKQEALAKGYSIIVTGHSLGGGLAGVASAAHQIQGVGFSAPGLLYQTKRMGISNQDLQFTFTEIQPQNDVVPRADVQMGAINWIKCAKDPLTCHMVAKTSCELWRRCGDPRGRDWRDKCKQ